ncbi:hypothetical protein KGA66_01515 [Actinocrinis puniceicyclus]|uniref:Uncharacterized protein n=1 Tax=Actinocrinis puniceicyclus TaxID=977794 RepID=A0A8J7WKB9_9ACTN|nr:hypothetical protein [Actinocrinis puniceicyclus]MBS2961707.1 hypothetical protein [Actinocrinis puniceicyclus]
MAHGPDCHCSVRRDYDLELAQFADRCLEFARGEGVPAALAHSESGAKQWVSDELTRRAGRLAAVSRRENAAWIALVGRQAQRGAWWLLAAVLVLDLATLPLSAGWTLPRTATPLAFLAFAALFTLFSLVHGDIGGVLCFLVGVDGRLSLPRTLGVLWASSLATAFVYFGIEDIAAGSAADRAQVAAAISHPHWEYLALLAAPVFVAVVSGAVSAARMRRRAAPYLPGQRSQLRDLLVEESGLGSLAAAVWLPVNLVGVLFLVVGLAKNPYQLPRLPDAVTVIALGAAALYLGVKLTEVRKPVLVSVVRVRTPGEPDGPIRQGDEIEIRGLGFVPAAARAPDQLSRIVVKLGPVHIHVPLVPDQDGGFANPTDTSVTVPIPYEAEPGPWTVRVVTAAGLETDDYPLDILADEV